MAPSLQPRRRPMEGSGRLGGLRSLGVSGTPGWVMAGYWGLTNGQQEVTARVSCSQDGHDHCSHKAVDQVPRTECGLGLGAIQAGWPVPEAAASPQSNCAALTGRRGRLPPDCAPSWSSGSGRGSPGSRSSCHQLPEHSGGTGPVSWGTEGRGRSWLPSPSLGRPRRQFLRAPSTSTATGVSLRG